MGKCGKEEKSKRIRKIKTLAQTTSREEYEERD